MKIKWIILIVVISIAVGFCIWYFAVDWMRISETEYAQWLTYTNAENGFSAKYPPNVTVQEDSTGVRFLGPENLGGIKWPNMKISLTQETKSDFNGDLVPGCDDRGNIIGGSPTRECIIAGATHNNNWSQYAVRDYQVLHNDRVYKVSIVSRKVDALPDINQKLLESIRFSD